MPTKLQKTPLCMESLSTCLKTRNNWKLFHPRSAEENAIKLLYLTKRVNQEPNFSYSMLGLVCNKNETCKFCSCYLQNDLMSVFRVCFGRLLFMSRSRGSNCFIVPPLPFSSAPLSGVQRYLWNSGAVNLSRELLRLRADFCLVCLAALFFYQSPEPQFTAQVHKQLFWLNDRDGAGLNTSAL